MEEIDVTWSRATRVWWSIVWRSFLFSVLAGAAGGLVLGIVLGVAGQAEGIQKYGQLVGILLGIPVGIWVVKTVLTKQFRRFRIVLVPSDEVMLTRAVNENSVGR